MDNFESEMDFSKSPAQEEEKSEELNFESNNSTEGIMLERGHHYCNLQHDFSKNFKSLYEKYDDRLFHNKNL